MATHHVRRVTVTPTLDTSAYADGDQMGALMTLEQLLSANRSGSELVLIKVLDKAKQSQPFDLFFFDAAPTLVGADNAAADISDADMEKCMGVVNVLAADYDPLANSSIATVAVRFPMVNLNKPADKCWLSLVSRGTPTYAANSLVITLTTVTEED